MNPNSFSIINSTQQFNNKNLDYYLTALKHQQQHQDQHQHHHDSSSKIRNFVNDLLANKQVPSLPQHPPPPLITNQCQCSAGVQYSSPWNSSNLAGVAMANTNKIASTSNSLISNLTGNSTLSGRFVNPQATVASDNENCGNGETFTSQQYLNERKMMLQQQGEIQEYSAINDDIKCNGKLLENEDDEGCEDGSLYSNQLI